MHFLSHDLSKRRLCLSSLNLFTLFLSPQSFLLVVVAVKLNNKYFKLMSSNISSRSSFDSRLRKNFASDLFKLQNLNGLTHVGRVDKKAKILNMCRAREARLWFCVLSKHVNARLCGVVCFAGASSYVNYASVSAMPITCHQHNHHHHQKYIASYHHVVDEVNNYNFDILLHECCVK